MKIYADTSDLNLILKLYDGKKVDGFTTNPSLMKKAGVKNYLEFAQQVLDCVRDLPVSFEIFADDFSTMRQQTIKLASLRENVFVKIPITNTKGESCINLIKELSALGVKLNVTAVFTNRQILETLNALDKNVNSILSVFSGRIADTGKNPCDFITYALFNKNSSKHNVLWASTREVYNIYEAQSVGCDIITVPPDILFKTRLFNKDLEEFSLETVKMFYDDAISCGYKL